MEFEKLKPIDQEYYHFLIKNDFILYELDPKAQYKYEKKYAFVKKDCLSRSDFLQKYEASLPIQLSQLEFDFFINNHNIFIIDYLPNSTQKFQQEFLISYVNNDNFVDLYDNLSFRFHYFFHYNEKEKFNDFLKKSNLSFDNQLKIIKKLPIKYFSIVQIELDLLQNIVDKSSLKSNQKDSFYLQFFKKNKSYLKLTNSSKAKDFLLQIYGHNEEKLKPYFSFFSTIKNLFQPIEFDIFEEKEIVFSSALNMKKVMKIFNNNPEFHIFEWLHQFAQAYANYHNLKIEYISLPQYAKERILECAFYTQNSEQNKLFKQKHDELKNQFNSLLKSFFVEMSQSNFSKEELSFYAKTFIQKHYIENSFYSSQPFMNNQKTKKI